MNVHFHPFRDQYNRSAQAVYSGSERIGGIVRLPKRTFPTPTWLVNDYRVTRPLLGTPAYTEAILYVGSLNEAKAVFQ